MPYDRKIGVFDPYARYTWQAPDRGILAESFPIGLATTQSAPSTAGRLEFAKIRLVNPASVTNILMYAQTGGSVLTSGQCFAVLYDGAGNRVGVSTDRAVAWASAGLQTMALVSGPFACAAGNYFVGFWYNGTTSPSWARSGGVAAAALNLGVSAPNFIVGNADTGLTTTSPATMGAQSSGGTWWWVGLS